MNKLEELICPQSVQYCKTTDKVLKLQQNLIFIAAYMLVLRHPRRSDKNDACKKCTENLPGLP